MRALLLAVRETAQLFGRQRILWLPFVCVTFVEALFVGLVWLAPHAPFSDVLAPPIRFFFGDRVLHYPAHLWFLYHVTRHAYIAATVLVGAFMTGVACAMVGQIHTGAMLSFRDVLVNRQVHYGRMLLVWIISWGIATSIAEGSARVAPKSLLGLLVVVGITVVLQALFVYAIPAAVFQRAKWWKALLSSVRETARYPLSTLAVVTPPTLLVIGLAVLVPPVKVAEWMGRTQPEWAVACVAVRLIVWMVADALLTVATAHLWWTHRAVSRAANPAVQVATARHPHKAAQQPPTQKHPLVA
ncbi:MAG: hypothetical protein HY352_05350 [Candidatus Omnitrophica bacterium]|nr:hypothetical protein [Candidatus Omnitrophota bacterium]